MPQALEGKHSSRHVVAAVMGELWAIHEPKLNQIVELLELRAQNLGFTRDEVQARIASGPGVADGPRVVNGVAVIPLHGPLAPRMNMMMQVSGGTSMQQAAQWVREAANNKDVRAIVLDVDSPGGTVSGTAELANVVESVRGTKPIKAVATNYMASGAYWVGCAADEIIASPSAQLGSIGVYMIHGETSRADANNGETYTVIKAGENKALQTGVEPLTAHGRGVLQEQIDDTYRMFIDAVAANRKVTAAAVEERFGKGKTMVASRAVAAGLADRVGTLEQVVSELASTGSSQAGKRSGETLAQVGGANTAQSAATKEDETVNPELKAALVKASVIAADASDEAAQAALNAYCHAKGVNAADTAAVIKALEHKPADPPATTQVAQPAADTAAQAVRDEQTRKAERARIEDLGARAELLGNVSAEQLAEAKEKGWDVPTALDHWTRRAANESTTLGRRDVRPGAASVDKFSAGAMEALGERLGLPSLGSEASGYAESLRFHSVMDVARQSLALANYRTELMDPTQVAHAALRGNGADIELIPRVVVDDQGRRRVKYQIGSASPLAAGADGGGYNRPSDFPNLMSNLMGRMLLPALEETETTYREWAFRMATLPDFRPKTVMELGAFGELPEHIDGYDFEGVRSPSEEANFIQVGSYGQEWSMTPKMMIDDDLDGLSRIVDEHVSAHERTINRLCINLLVGNPTMPDGTALFHADHTNLIDTGSGGVPQQSQFKAVRLKLRKQTGVGAVTKLNQKFWGILIPEDLEEDTERALANLPIMPTAASGVETFRGKVRWMVDTMLGEASAAVWYGMANPQRSRAICYAHQTGFESLRVRVYFNDKNNCRVHQFEGRFAAIARTHRGIVKNVGA